MRLLDLFRHLRGRTPTSPPGCAITVLFDDQLIRVRRRDVADVQVRFSWASIRRVCFKDNGPLASDLIHVFVAGRAKAITIPLEAAGGGEFWRALRDRNVVPAQFHEQATLSTDGRLYCWPPLVREH